MEPTSGALASLAKQIVNSGKYAVAYVNAHGGVNGRPLKLLTYNTQLDPATAATDYEQAATQDHVVAVLGPLISPEVNAALPVAQRTQTPMLLPGAADIVFTKPVKQYVFRVGSNESQDDAAMAALAKHLGCTKPALLYDNGALGLSTQSDIAKDIPHFTVSVESSATATDLTPELQKIRQAGAQCIIEGSDDLGGVGSMVATMANTGYKVPIMGDSALTLAPFVATAGAAVNTVPVYGTDVFNPDSSFFKHLYAGYVKQYGTVPPGEEIGTTWDSVQILATALKADGGKGGSALASALQNVSGSSLTSLIGHGGATPSFSATSHDWVPPAQDRMYRVLPGSPKLVATGVGG
jgi:branched-chain amino acid transport system substrate-binding protein